MSRPEFSRPDLSRPDLDLGHLERQCLGDAALARELLALFERQCERLVTVLADEHAAPALRRDAAHGLCGSARAVGADRIAVLAAALEADLERRDLGEAGIRTLALVEAAASCRRAIRRRLGAPLPWNRSDGLAKPDRVA